MVCYDKCRVDFENCRDHEEPECEEDLDKCQNECDRKAVHVKDEIWKINKIFYFLFINIYSYTYMHIKNIYIWYKLMLFSWYKNNFLI